MALVAGTHPDALLDFATSSNPLGPPEWLRRLADRFSGVTFIIDETFADFIADYDRLTVNWPANGLVLLSVTRVFAWGWPSVKPPCRTAPTLRNYVPTSTDCAKICTGPSPRFTA